MNTHTIDNKMLINGKLYKKQQQKEEDNYQGIVVLINAE